MYRQQPSSPNASPQHHHGGIPMQVKQELHEIASKCGELSNKIDAFSTSSSPNTLMLENDVAHLRRQNEELTRRCIHLEEMLRRASGGSGGELRDDVQMMEQEKNGLDSRNHIQALESKVAQMTKDNLALKQRLDDFESTIAHMTAQLITYKEDFETERKDRERAQGKIAELEIEIQQWKQQRTGSRPMMISAEDHTRAMPQVYQPFIQHNTTASPSHHYQYPPQQSYNTNNHNAHPYLVRPNNGYDVCDDIETDSKQTKPDYVVFDHPASQSNLRGRGVEMSKYQTDDIDNDDVDCSPASAKGYTVTDSVCPRSSGTYIKTCGVVGDRTTPHLVGSNRGCASKTPSPPSSRDDTHSFGLRLSSVDDVVSRSVRHSPPRNMSEDVLQCPKCFKGFQIEDHHLLLEHIEEVCMH